MPSKLIENKDKKTNVAKAEVSANKGKIRNPKGRGADKVKLDVSFEEAIKIASSLDFGESKKGSK